MSSSNPGSSRPRPASLPRPAPAPSPSLAIPSIRPSLPLSLTIRFSTHVPDLHLEIPNPTTTTIAALRSLIRARLPSTASTRRLRFIHAGKILSPTNVLSAIARAAPPPPPPPPPDTDDARGKGKGKAPEGAAPVQRIYVNCSIGDTLTEKELAQEEEEAARPAPESAALTPLSSGSRSPGPDDGAQTTAESSLLQRRAQRPQGFDRLLASGFTAAEVHSLRLQFRGITAARHTADTMPSPDGMRRLEDAWMDSNHTGGGAPALGMGGATAGGEEGEGGEGTQAMVDMDMLVLGMLIGFVWPLGSAGWVVKEEGMLGYNWRLFVTFGFLLSALVGMVKSIGG